MGGDGGQERHHGHHIVGALEVRDGQSDQDQQTAPGEAQQQAALGGVRPGQQTTALGQQHQQRQGQHRQIAIQPQLQIEPERLAALVQPAGDLHVPDLGGESRPALVMGQLDQRPPAQGEQGETGQAIAKEALQGEGAARRLAPGDHQPVEADHATGLDQPQRAADGEAQGEQRQHQQAAQRAAVAVGAMEQVEAEQHHQGDQLVQADRAGLFQPLRGQGHQQHREQCPGTAGVGQQAIGQRQHRGRGQGGGQHVGQVIGRADHPRGQPAQPGGGAGIVRIGLAVGGGEKGWAMAKHLAEEDRPATVEALGRLVPDAEGEHQGGDHPEQQAFTAQATGRRQRVEGRAAWGQGHGRDHQAASTRRVT